MNTKPDSEAPVALIFFNRPKPLTRTFEAIRASQPRELFLIQDGPRPGVEGDIEKVRECREIVSAVDWECTVHRDLSEENLGTGRRVSSGLTWAFAKVDRLIILEDDCLPSPDFFPFCTQLLERYKSDQRVGMITGMNHLGTYDETPYDYLFSRVGSIAGWATWRRVWGSMEQDLAFLEDPEAMRLLSEYLKARGMGQRKLRYGRRLKARMENGVALTSWSYPLGIGDVLNSRLIIAPSVNLMSNIGVGPDGVNTVETIAKVPKGARFLYSLPLHHLGPELKHPRYLCEDLQYNRRVDKIMGRTVWRGAFRRIESVVRRVIHGESIAGIIRRWRARVRQDGRLVRSRGR